MANKILAGLMVLGMSVVVACGGDSEGGTLNSGLPSTKKANELSTSEAQKLCDAAEKSFSSSGAEASTCKLVAVLAATLASAGGADLKTSCKTAYDECLKDDSGSGQPDMCEAAPANCTATVGEIEACWNDTIKQLNSIAGKLPSCDNISQNSLSNLNQNDFNTEDPASCKTVQQKCPGFLDDEQSGGSGL